LGQTQNEKADYTTCHWCWQVVPVAEMATESPTLPVEISLEPW
jgi:protein-disulfide isomerase-like protein with CxxC motif